MPTPKFEYDINNDGFDENPKPDWFMVPLNKTRKIYLSNGEGTTLASSNPAVAVARFDDSLVPDPDAYGRRGVLIEGKAHGHTFIEVRKGHIIQTQLEVGVKRLKKVRLAFNFVSDNAGHHTDYVPADADGFLMDLHTIFTSQ